MLIKALCDYYDLLKRSGKVLPDGYSKVGISYVVALNADGSIDDILDVRETLEVSDKKKQRKIPKEIILPLRTEKSGIEANIIDHRPLYIFGLNMEKNALNPNDETYRATNSHKDFVKKNLDFIKELDTPVVNAYRNFLLGWNPAGEINNEKLLSLGRNYSKSKYAFCLTGFPDKLLSDDPDITSCWNDYYKKTNEDKTDDFIAQCAITGKTASIARLHNKIKGLPGQGTGGVLVLFNNPSDSSYSHTQSYNSNISIGVMKKYTKALNFLLKESAHRVTLDDATVVFWAMDDGKQYEELFSKLYFGSQDDLADAKKTEEIIKHLLIDAKSGGITGNNLEIDNVIKKDVDFYLLGLKTNKSRISIKFIYRKKYADLMYNLARFQNDINMSQDDPRPIPLYKIKNELLSQKNKKRNENTKDKIDPALVAKIMNAAINNLALPEELFSTVIRRVKTDSDGKNDEAEKTNNKKSESAPKGRGVRKINAIRVGIIKACINRKHKKEVIKLALDKENLNQGYLLGRLFAVLEKLQRDASSTELNRTIKDAFFASASSTPALIFPKLMKLSQYHLSKLDNHVYYDIMIGEIIDNLNGGFPQHLSIEDQGKFIVGYYQQNQVLYKSNKISENTENIEAAENTDEEE